MAVLGASVKTLSPWYTHGSRRIGSCTTRRKKTMRKQMRRHKTVAGLLDEWEPDPELVNLDQEFFFKHVRPLIGRPPVYGTTSNT